MLLHTSLQELRQNINQRLNPQRTPHTSPWWASYGMSFVNILEKIARVITARHWPHPGLLSTFVMFCRWCPSSRSCTMHLTRTHTTSTWLLLSYSYLAKMNISIQQYMKLWVYVVEEDISNQLSRCPYDSVSSVMRFKLPRLCSRSEKVELVSGTVSTFLFIVSGKQWPDHLG